MIFLIDKIRNRLRSINPYEATVEGLLMEITHCHEQASYCVNEVNHMLVNIGYPVLEKAINSIFSAFTEIFEVSNKFYEMKLIKIANAAKETADKLVADTKVEVIKNEDTRIFNAFEIEQLKAFKLKMAVNTFLRDEEFSKITNSKFMDEEKRKETMEQVEKELQKKVRVCIDAMTNKDTRFLQFTYDPHVISRVCNITLDELFRNSTDVEEAMRMKIRDLEEIQETNIVEFKHTEDAFKDIKINLDQDLERVYLDGFGGLGEFVNERYVKRTIETLKNDLLKTVYEKNKEIALRVIRQLQKHLRSKQVESSSQTMALEEYEDLLKKINDLKRENSLRQKTANDSIKRARDQNESQAMQYSSKLAELQEIISKLEYELIESHSKISLLELTTISTATKAKNTAKELLKRNMMNSSIQQKDGIITISIKELRKVVLGMKEVIEKGTTRTLIIKDVNALIDGLTCLEKNMTLLMNDPTERIEKLEAIANSVAFTKVSTIEELFRDVADKRSPRNSIGSVHVSPKSREVKSYFERKKTMTKQLSPNNRYGKTEQKKVNNKTIQTEIDNLPDPNSANDQARSHTFDVDKLAVYSLDIKRNKSIDWTRTEKDISQFQMMERVLKSKQKEKKGAVNVTEGRNKITKIKSVSVSHTFKVLLPQSERNEIAKELKKEKLRIKKSIAEVNESHEKSAISISKKRKIRLPYLKDDIAQDIRDNEELKQKAEGISFGTASKKKKSPIIPILETSGVKSSKKLHDFGEEKAVEGNFLEDDDQESFLNNEYTGVINPYTPIELTKRKSFSRTTTTKLHPKEKSQINNSISIKSENKRHRRNASYGEGYIHRTRDRKILVPHSQRQPQAIYEAPQPINLIQYSQRVQERKEIQPNLSKFYSKHVDHSQHPESKGPVRFDVRLEDEEDCEPLIPKEIENRMKQLNPLIPQNSAVGKIDAYVEELFKYYKTTPSKLLRTGKVDVKRLEDMMGNAEYRRVKKVIKKEVNKFIAEHQKCGEECKHLLRFYSRLGIIITSHLRYKHKRQLSLSTVKLNEVVQLSTNQKAIF